MAATAERADVLFYVQHLLGIGHLNRAAVIARALARAGLKTVVVTGGMPVQDLDVGDARLIQLPPARVMDESFKLADERGRPVTEAWRNTRRDRLLALYRDLRPKLLLIELFPFGRRKMRFELMPLLEAAAADRRHVKVVCSLRDILSGDGTPEKAAWMLETFERIFDLAIVHGDPDFLTLDVSFPEARRVAAKLEYSGYVTAETTASPLAGSDGEGEVIVSTGGGAVAEPLISAALEARPLSPLADAPWRLLIGQNMPERRFRHFRSRAAAGVRVERARPDFRALLGRCRLSISQAGYNTIMDLLASGAPAVVVPFGAGGETEQGLRAGLLADKGWLTVVAENGLTGESLARGIAAALRRGRQPGGPKLAVDGAQRTAARLAELVASIPR